MKNIKELLFLLLSVLLIVSCSKNSSPTGGEGEPEQPAEVMADRVEGRIALGYVTYYGKNLPDPKYLTHVNFAFAELYMNGNEYVKFGLQGDRLRFDQVKQAIKQSSGAQMLLSFTNTVSNADNKKGGGFSALAKSAEMRKRFAQDCKDFVQREGIDGIDIDWEFPGMTFGSNAYDTQVDVDNFTLLMKDLREVLGKNILLTYAGYCMNVQNTSDGGRKYIDVAAVDPYVDFVNVMTYDLVSAPKHQSAIYAPDAYWDCMRSIKSYVDAGILPSKLVLGIPFYGRKDFASGGYIEYNKIIKLSKADGYIINHWNTDWQAPYVTKNGEMYCGYDNARSISAKGNWVKHYGMKGMMFWDYDGDDTNGTLRKALWNAVMKK